MKIRFEILNHDAVKQVDVMRLARFSLCTANGKITITVIVDKAGIESSDASVISFNGRTSGGKNCTGIVSIESLAIRNPNHDEVVYGHLDVEVPDSYEWGKDGSKIHLL